MLSYLVGLYTVLHTSTDGTSHLLTVRLLPFQFYSPDIFSGCLPRLPDGFALLLVLIPACRLAGAIAVVGKLAMGAAEQLSLATETAVAHLAGKTARGRQNTRYHCQKPIPNI